MNTHDPFSVTACGRSLSVALALLLGLVAAPAARSQDNYWTGNSSTDWGTVTNWSLSQLPGTNRPPIFDASANTFTVDLGSSSRSVPSMTLNSSSAYTFQDTAGNQTLTPGNVTVSSGTGHVFNVPIVLAGTTDYAISSGAALTINGVVSGSGNLTKSGDGTLTFNGSNTYSGMTTINAGTLKISNGNENALVNSAVTVGSGATLQFDDEDQWEYSMASLAGSGTMSIGYGTVVFGTDNATTTFSGSVNDGGTTSGVLEKKGTGTVTFGGSGWNLGRINLTTGDMVIDGMSGTVYVLDTTTSTNLTIKNVDAGLSTRLSNGGNTTITGAATSLESASIFNGGTLTLDAGASVAADVFSQQSGRTTTVDQATLTIDAFQAVLKVGTIAISDPTGGTALTIGDSTNSSFDGIIADHSSGPGSVIKTGTGTITLNGANTYSGTTTINAGTLTISNGNQNPLANSAVTIGSGGLLKIDDADSYTYSVASLSGSGTLSIGYATVVFGTNNATTTFSGAVTDNGTTSGVLEKWGTGTVTFNGAGYDLGTLGVVEGAAVVDGMSGTLSALSASGSTSLTIQNVDAGLNLFSISNTGTTVVTGGSATSLTVAILQNYNALTIEAGAAVSTGNFGQTSGRTTTVDQATLAIDAFQTVNNVGTIAISDPTGGTALTIGDSTNSSFNGIIADHSSGPGSVIKTGTGTITLNGANTYSGTTTINAGTLRLGNALALQNTTVNLAVANGLDLNNLTVTLGGISGSNNLALGSRVLTVGGNDESTTYSGVLSGVGGGLTKTGTGTLTLSASSHSYSGGTIVNGGTLVVNGSITGGSMDVSAGARLGGNGTIDDLTLAGTLAPGNSPGTLTANNVSWDQGASYVWETNATAGSAGTNWDLLDANGTLFVGSTPGNPFTIFVTSLDAGNNAGPLTSFDPGEDYSWVIATANGQILGFDADAFVIDASAFQNNTNASQFSLSLANFDTELVLNFTAVPEPGTYGLLVAGGLVAFAGYRRSRIDLQPRRFSG